MRIYCFDALNARTFETLFVKLARQGGTLEIRDLARPLQCVLVIEVAKSP